MNWIFLALGAHFLWALVNIGEKHLISNWIKNPFVYLCLALFLNIMVLPIALLVKIDLPDWHAGLYIFLASAFYLLGTIFYIVALQREEVSRINILWQLIPVFNLTIAYLLFRETLSLSQSVAFVLLIAGGILASLHRGDGRWRWSKALGVMAAACFFYSCYAVSFSRLSDFFEPISAWWWSSLVLILMMPGFLFFSKIRHDLAVSTPRIKRGVWAAIIGVNFLDSGAMLLNMLALSLGPVSLVYCLEGAQIIFVFALTIFLSFKAPKILKEELNKANLWLKGGALILILVGLWLIY